LIHGNTAGIRDAWLEQLEEFYNADKETLRHFFLSPELLEPLARISSRINREISIYIARDGMVMDVSLGTFDRVELTDLRLRRGARRLSGIRCIHTHPSGTPVLSDVDIRTLKRMRFDAMACVSVQDETPTGFSCAMLSELNEAGEYEVREYGPYRIADIPQEELLYEIRTHEQTISQAARLLSSRQDQGQRAILLGIDQGRGMDSLEELGRLAETAGAEVLHMELQKRSGMDAATYVGQGKVQEMALLRQVIDANLVITDDELTGAQLRNLEAALGCPVVDRTGLILDIFAQRATTYEGKLQVELAQYKYRLPRLAGRGTALSRQGGGIGTRGPGETQLESDRRMIYRRIHDLEEEMKRLEKHRDLQRRHRARNRIPVIALVGYTNAGKSTLLNALTQGDAFVEDKLFATLDPLAKRLELPGGVVTVLVDTVGFIHKLPHDLVDAFHSTLEEALYADLLVHVVDASSPEARLQFEVAETVLQELGAGTKPRILALNKCDLAGEETEIFEENMPTVRISAARRIGLDELLAEIADQLSRRIEPEHWVIPYEMGALQSMIHERCQVLETSYEEDGVHITAIANPAMTLRVRMALGEIPEKEAEDWKV